MSKDSKQFKLGFTTVNMRLQLGTEDYWNVNESGQLKVSTAKLYFNPVKLVAITPLFNVHSCGENLTNKLD